MWKDVKGRRDLTISVGWQYSSISRVINNFKTAGICTSKPRSGRPSKLSIREKR
ncbi:hypothetical protein TNCV_1101021, partial [Trichonephila clavipes]